MGELRLPLPPADGPAQRVRKGVAAREGKKDDVRGELELELSLARVPRVPTGAGDSDAEREFVVPLWEGRAQSIYSSMHPQLQALVDREVLAGRFRAYARLLGHCLGSDGLNVHKNVAYRDGHKVSTDSKALKFEHGKATVEREFLDDQLVGFSFKAPEIAEGAFSIDPHEHWNRGIEFWFRFFDSDVPSSEIWALLAAPLQQTLETVDALQKMREAFRAAGKAGKLLEVRPDTQDQHAQRELTTGATGLRLELPFTLVQILDPAVAPSGRREFPGKIVYVMQGFQLLLFGFHASV
jgi:hypothetical protein